MDAGGLAQSTHNTFAGSNRFGMPNSGLPSRRGGQNLAPLSVAALNSPSGGDNGAPTPRTSRSHLLVGLRTAPKSATAATFPNNPSSPTTALPPQTLARKSMYSDSLYSGPKTALPRYGSAQQGYNQGAGYGQHFTAEQILAPPEIQLDDPSAANMDPNLYAQLVATNAYLAQQQQRLQQQLMSVQAAAQQFQGLNVGAAQPLQQAYQNLYQQQQMKQTMAVGVAQPNIYTMIDPITGQQTFYMEQNAVANHILEQQQQQQMAAGYGLYQQAQPAAPRVQVSPPTENAMPAFRNSSPPRRFDSPDEPTPLPPPSANAFRRGHKKASSLAIDSSHLGASSNGTEPPKSAGPKSANFPLTPLSAAGSYGPGHGRAGEHPIRQPRGPPSFDELAAKPTAKHEGSKNFVTRTRRSAVHNLVRARLERRKGTGSSLGSISPIDESAEDAEVDTPLTDNDSDSGRSGSGSLGGEEAAESTVPSSRTSTGSWGAIGSERPHSRQKTRESAGSGAAASDSEPEMLNGGGNSSFASVFKHGTPKKTDGGDMQRKAPMLVLTSAEKRKGNAILVA